MMGSLLENPAKAWLNILSLSCLTVFAGCQKAVEEPVVATTQDVVQYDVVIVNGRIVDGTGNGWFYGDLGIKIRRLLRLVPVEH